MRALVVIDVQKNLVARKLYRKEEFLASVRDAISSFRASGAPVVFVQDNENFLVAGDEGRELDGSLGARKSDAVLQKRKGNCFEETGMAELLRSRGADEVLFCGLVSYGCVKASCLGALASGFRAALLRGGHSCWSKDAAEKISRTEDELSRAGVALAAAPP